MCHDCSAGLGGEADTGSPAGSFRSGGAGIGAETLAG